MDFASNEQEVWNALRNRAAGELSRDFAAGVVRAAALERRQSRVQTMAFAGVITLLCVAYGAFALTRVEASRKREALWMEYRQGQALALKTL